MYAFIRPSNIVANIIFQKKFIFWLFWFSKRAVGAYREIGQSSWAPVSYWSLRMQPPPSCNLWLKTKNTINLHKRMNKTNFFFTNFRDKKYIYITSCLTIYWSLPFPPYLSPNFWTLSWVLLANAWHIRSWATLEMDSGYKNENIGFYPKAPRPFLRILCVFDDYALEWAPLCSARKLRRPCSPSLKFMIWLNICSHIIVVKHDYKKSCLLKKSPVKISVIRISLLGVLLWILLIDIFCSA